MPEATLDVKWYLDHVEVEVDKATEEVVKQLAFRIVERARLNIRSNDQVDTGFLINSIYAIWKAGSGYGDAAAAAAGHTLSSKGGGNVDHSKDMAPVEQLPADASAGVVVGAVYAIFQEVINAFLYGGGRVRRPGDADLQGSFAR